MLDADADEFYARIRMLVKQKNITLLVLCVEADFNINTYNTACHNKRFLKGDVIARMAGILGVSTDFLITGREHGQILNDKQECLWQMMCSLEGAALADITKLTRFYLRDQQETKNHQDSPKKPRSLMKSE
jgi:transcriptional regulator with XRE-family HTH domain